MAKVNRVKKNKDSGGNYFTSPKSIQFVSSGCTLLDNCLGGGYPLGRIVNIVGDKSTGKTLLAIEACANFAKTYKDGKIWYHEAEAAFDIDYAAGLGLPTKNIEFIDEDDTIELLFAGLEKAAIWSKETGKPGLYIIDSLDALTDDAEKGRDFNEGTYGNKAKKLSLLFRLLIRKVKQSSILVIVISQIRAKLGVTFGKKTTRSGGRALDFYASQVLFLAEIKKIPLTRNSVKRIIGILVKGKLEKNKIGLPYRECEFSILFNYGIDDISTNIKYLLNENKLNDIVPEKILTNRRYNKELTELYTGVVPDRVKALESAVNIVYNEHEDDFVPIGKKYK